jgi:hypothetical protein
MAIGIGFTGILLSALIAAIGVQALQETGRDVRPPHPHSEQGSR